MQDLRQTAAAGLLLLAAAAACTPAARAQGDQGASDPGARERGAAIAAQWCSQCHATGAAPEASDVAPSFYEIAERRTPDYIRGFLANPHVRGQMPPFELSTRHVEDVLAYLLSLR